MNPAPPSRYRVVERGRRLEVIDTRAGVPAVQRPANAEPAAPRPATGLSRHWPHRTRFDGTAEVMTHRLYDAKAPRTIALDPVLAGRFEWMKWATLVAVIVFAAGVAAFPWLFAAPVMIHLLGAGTQGRKWATRRIDAIVARG